MFVSVNGVRLYFDVEGSHLTPAESGMDEKPTVVMVHGGPGADHSHYRPTYSQLSDIAQVVYYDHRGNGRSDFSSSEHWNLDQWADDLKGLCDSLGIEKPIILGTSFGGFVTQAYVTKYPDHPRKLILISTAAKMDFERVFAAFANFGGTEAGNIAREYWTNPTAEGRALFRDKCVPLYQQNTDDMRSALSRCIVKDDTALWFNGPKNEHGRMDFREDLQNVTCPTLVLGGALDPITPIEFSETIAGSLPTELTEYHRFENAGHGVIGDAPDEAFQIMRKFISQR